MLQHDWIGRPRLPTNQRKEDTSVDDANCLRVEFEEALPMIMICAAAVAHRRHTAYTGKAGE